MTFVNPGKDWSPKTRHGRLVKAALFKLSIGALFSDPEMFSAKKRDSALKTLQNFEARPDTCIEDPPRLPSAPCDSPHSNCAAKSVVVSTHFQGIESLTTLLK
jgi:hypothetical protein